MTVTKIVDNTVITAALSEIKCVDLFSVCSNVYHLATSSEVYSEASDGFDSQTLSGICGLFRIFDKTSDHDYAALFTYLQNRYPYLGLGEISSFLVALLEYEMQNREYYYVTDDGRMRKVIGSLKKNADALFIKHLGSTITRFRDTGTIGLIIRLCQKGKLSKARIDDVANELERSTFRLTPVLIKQLKGCRDENSN